MSAAALPVLPRHPARTAPVLPDSGGRVLAQTSPCTTTDGPGAAYTITICLTAPDDGATVTGDTTVTTRYTRVAKTAPVPTNLGVTFYLNGAYVLADHRSLYTFVLPTARWADGTYRLEADVQLSDGFDYPPASISLTFNNGISQPPTNPRAFSPATPGGELVVAAAGDGADSGSAQRSVVDQVATWNPDMFLYLGDVYDNGTSTEFHNWYHPTWGRFRAITNPTVGNHEYAPPLIDGAGYVDYWDNIPYYYSYDAGGWHFVSLNMIRQFGQYAEGSAQMDWLIEDLQQSANPCTIVYFHNPVIRRSGGINPRLRYLWSVLNEHGVDLVMTGDVHAYERWLPLDSNFEANTGGVTHFIVGTGGHGFNASTNTDPRLRTAIDSTHGALRLNLHADAADFAFVTTGGSVLDSGSIPCVRESEPLITPTPTNTPTATATNTPTATATTTFVPGPPSITLDKAKSKYNGWVTATLSGFEPGREITLRWPGGAVLAQVRADASGIATTRFRTPLVPLGNYTVRATDQTDNVATTELRVIPRIKTTESEGPPGTRLRVYFYGFAPGNRVEVRWYERSSFEVLETLTIADNGRASSIIFVPDDARVGEHTLRGKVIGIGRSASTSFEVTDGDAGEAEERPAPTPFATPTATSTATPTATPVLEPSATATVTATLTATPTADFGTATATLEPTVVPSVEATATAVVTATITEVAVGPTPYPIAQTSRSASTVPGTNAIDGEPATVWQTADGTDPGRVAVLTLELEGEVPIGEVRILPGPSGLLGTATVEVSMDGETWSYVGEPDASRADDDGWVSVQLNTHTTMTQSFKYVRVVFVGSVEEQPLGGIAEIEVLPPR